MKILTDKVCVVTGAGKGFGLDIAKKLYDNGANLALLTRSENDIQGIKEYFKDDKRILAFLGDASNNSSVNNFISETIIKFKTIDILINNAGMRFRKPFLHTTYDDFNTVLNNNIGSVFHMTQAVLPIMIKNNFGKIINVASIVGILGFNELSAYAASKGSIISITKSLAIEYAKYGININAIAPGFCKTSYYENFIKNDKLYKFTIERTPLNRWGKSDEIADLVVFLSSSMSNYTTGQVINIDGGWTSG